MSPHEQGDSHVESKRVEDEWKLFPDASMATWGVPEPAELLDLSPRQIQRLKARFRRYVHGGGCAYGKMIRMFVKSKVTA